MEGRSTSTDFGERQKPEEKKKQWKANSEPCFLIFLSTRTERTLSLQPRSERRDRSKCSGESNDDQCRRRQRRKEEKKKAIRPRRRSIPVNLTFCSSACSAVSVGLPPAVEAPTGGPAEAPAGGPAPEGGCCISGGGKKKKKKKKTGGGDGDEPASGNAFAFCFFSLLLLLFLARQEQRSLSLCCGEGACKRIKRERERNCERKEKEAFSVFRVE